MTVVQTARLVPQGTVGRVGTNDWEAYWTREENNEHYGMHPQPKLPSSRGAQTNQVHPTPNLFYFIFQLLTIFCASWRTLACLLNIGQLGWGGERESSFQKKYKIHFCVRLSSPNMQKLLPYLWVVPFHCPTDCHRNAYLAI